MPGPDPLAGPVLHELLIVADTDILSFLFKRDTRAELYRRHLEGRRPVISAQTLAELHHWPVFRKWGERRRRDLDQFLRNYPVVYPDEQLCRRWGEVTARAALAGKPLPATDAWQAATALYLDVPLIAHSPRNYEGAAGLVLVTEAR